MNRGSPRASRSDLALASVGLLLTIGLISPYRPWGVGPSPLNYALFLGPILLAAAAAGSASRARADQAGTPRRGGMAGHVPPLAIGLLLLLVGGCPWIYTPLLFGGESNSSSGMLGTIIFVLVGMPGLVYTAIALVNLALRRRARAASKPIDLPTGEADIG